MFDLHLFMVHKALQAIGIFTHTFVVNHTLQLIMVLPTW